MNEGGTGTEKGPVRSAGEVEDKDGTVKPAAAAAASPEPAAASEAADAPEPADAPDPGADGADPRGEVEASSALFFLSPFLAFLSVILFCSHFARSALRTLAAQPQTLNPKPKTRHPQP